LSGTWAALLNLATDAATALTLVLRDASGRFKAAEPSASSDVATKNYTDTAVAVGRSIFTAGCLANNSGVTANYLFPWNSRSNATTTMISAPAPGTLVSKACVVINQAGSGSGTVTYTLMKNSLATTCTATISAGATTGRYEFPSFTAVTFDPTTDTYAWRVTGAGTIGSFQQDVYVMGY
jgi:hypothetical protein